MANLYYRTKKTFLLPFFLFTLLLVVNAAQASHIRGGQIYYKSDTTAARNPLRYFFTLVTYSVAPPAFEDLEATLYFGDCSSQQVARFSRVLVLNSPLGTFVNTYKFEHTYSGPGDYKVTFIGDSHQGGVVNIVSSIKPTFFLQSTITVDRLLGTNRSPIFQQGLLDIPYQNQLFTHNSGAFDADGDSLAYKLVIPATSNGQTACGNPVGTQTPGFSGLENFLGTPNPAAPAGLTLNNRTGLFTWNSPSHQGIFNVAIQVEEWRDGRLIGTVTRDMLLYGKQTPSIITGISDDWQGLISTFPNPATSALTLKMPASVQLRAAYLYTALGAPATMPALVKSAHGYTLPVAALPNGLYLLHLRTSHGSMVQKVVVKK